MLAPSLSRLKSTLLFLIVSTGKPQKIAEIMNARVVDVLLQKGDDKISCLARNGNPAS